MGHKPYTTSRGTKSGQEGGTNLSSQSCLHHLEDDVDEDDDSDDNVDV